MRTQLHGQSLDDSAVWQVLPPERVNTAQPDALIDDVVHAIVATPAYTVVVDVLPAVACAFAVPTFALLTIDVSAAALGAR
jgi:hypothetical protein